MTIAFRRPEAMRVEGKWISRLALAYAYAGLFTMWGVWTLLVIFLCAPRTLLQWWPWLPTIDAAPRSPVAFAVIVDAALIMLFGLQHSVMARPWFKQKLALLPPPLVRVTYVYAANFALALIVLGWQPLPAPLWHITWKPLEVAIWTLFAGGWLMLLAGALSFGIRDLLGITAVEHWLSRGRPAPETLKTGLLYRWVEHPMYIGVLTAFWATPRMSVGHMLLAAGMTLYVLIAMRYEKRDLAARFGRNYTQWRGTVARRVSPS